MGRRPKPKRIAYELIEPESEPVMYHLMHDLIALHHQHLRHAKIALAWCYGWKPDSDGRVTLGQCRKATDLDRELMVYDVVILLSRTFWTNEAVSGAQRKALLDHELCHAEVRLNKYGEPVEDERGRKVYRIRKHDIEEFSEIVERHGCYKHDLEEFASALRRAPQGVLPIGEPA